MQAIANAFRVLELKNSQEAIRVLDIILHQHEHAAKQGCLLVRQNFFHNDPRNFADVGGGVLGCRGFHSSFRTTQGSLSLNISSDVQLLCYDVAFPLFLLDAASINLNNAKKS
uniref:Argonaute linker 1 domain-containing protein n=1 Tax=Manihot esculenta TaxID=3983 RepID=A0A2C9WC67_MANES